MTHLSKYIIDMQLFQELNNFFIHKKQTRSNTNKSKPSHTQYQKKTQRFFNNSNPNSRNPLPFRPTTPLRAKMSYKKAKKRSLAFPKGLGIIWTSQEWSGIP